MGVRISWDGRPTDMSDSKQSLISAMEEYIKRNSDSFINDFALAEERFEDDDSKYPIEDLDKMEEKFQDFFKEIKKRDLASFIRSLPKNKTWGDFKEIMGKSEILEGKTVGDLLDPSFRNILVGRGAFEYGREMEGIPPFNFFDSDLGEPSLKFDLVIKQTKGKKGNQFMIAPASGVKMMLTLF